MNSNTIKKISATTASTWLNKRIAKARRARHHVKVRRTEYRSVAQAFGALGLPPQKAKSFRTTLVAAKSAEFNGIRFALLA